MTVARVVHGFHFQRQLPSPMFYHKINFRPLLGPPKIETRAGDHQAYQSAQVQEDERFKVTAIFTTVLERRRIKITGKKNG